jgi:hypothetical protein
LRILKEKFGAVQGGSIFRDREIYTRKCQSDISHLQFPDLCMKRVLEVISGDSQG